MSAVGDPIFHEAPTIFELYVSGLYHEDIYERGEHADERRYISPRSNVGVQSRRRDDRERRRILTKP